MNLLKALISSNCQGGISPTMAGKLLSCDKTKLINVSFFKDSEELQVSLTFKCLPNEEDARSLDVDLVFVNVLNVPLLLIEYLGTQLFDIRLEEDGSLSKLYVNKIVEVYFSSLFIENVRFSD